MGDSDSSDSSSSEAEESQSPPKKIKQYKKFQNTWLTEFPWLEKNVDPTKVRCRTCNKILNAGKSELQKHEDGKTHKQLQKAINFQPSVFSFTKEETLRKEKVKTAEIKLSVFFAEHNVPIHTIDHFIDLLKEIVDDLEIIKNMNLKRTKCTEILKNVVATVETDRLIEILKANTFSVLVDESTDVSTEKNLCVLVRYLDPANGKIQTRLLELIKTNALDSSAEALYNEFKKCFLVKKIPLSNIVAMASDNCNTMTGKHNSFYTRLKQDVPDLILVGCICHSAALVASKACEQLARTPEELVRSTLTYVSGSAKRCSELTEMQNYFHTESKKLLKLSTTRWLSRHACVTRYLDNYAVLKHYFQMAVIEDKLKSAEFILHELNNDFNRAYLHFLKFALHPLTAFNAFFQSRNIQIHVLYEKSSNLIKQLCQNFLKMKIVLEQDLGKINLENPSYYLPLEKVYVGTDCESVLNTLPQNGVHDFRLKCLNFYKTSAREMQKRLPLSDNIFKEIKFLDVETVQKDLQFNLRDLPKHFQNYLDISKLEIEWRNLKVNFNSISEHVRKLPVDEMWKEIGQIKDFDDQPAFANISKLAHLSLILPHSNAEAERIFSIVSDVKIKKRNRLGAETLNAICVVRSSLQSSNETCIKYKRKNICNYLKKKCTLL